MRVCCSYVPWSFGNLNNGSNGGVVYLNGNNGPGNANWNGALGLSRRCWLRPRVFLKARRQFLRAGRELEATGRIPRFRCYKLVSHYGPFKHSDSRRAQENLDVQNLVKIAKATIARTERYRTMKQKGVILP